MYKKKHQTLSVCCCGGDGSLTFGNERASAQAAHAQNNLPSAPGPTHAARTSVPTALHQEPT